MKRSEMCKIINEYMNSPKQDATASTLLEVIEDAGMLPPLVSDPGYFEGDHFYINRWELEDDAD